MEVGGGPVGRDLRRPGSGEEDEQADLSACPPATDRESFRDRPTAFHYGRTATDDRVTWMTGMPSPWTGKLTVRLDESRDSPPR